MTSTLLCASHPAPPDALCLSAPSTRQPQAARYTLGDLEQRALAAHPALAVAQAESQAIKQAAEQAGALPNPVVGYQGEDIRAGAPTYGGQHGVFMEQVIPLGGKLHVRRDALLQQGRASEAAIDVARAARAGGCARRLCPSPRRRRTRACRRESLEATLDESVQTSRQLYNIGMADRPDLLEVEAESARGGARLRAARRPGSRVDGARRAPSAIRRFRVGSWRAAIADLPQLADRATAWQTTRAGESTVGRGRAAGGRGRCEHRGGTLASRLPICCCAAARCTTVRARPATRRPTAGRAERKSA